MTGMRVRPLTRGLRGLLLVAAGLVALASFQLFVLTDHTDKYFSWTIEPGMTAAFLGAGYFASIWLELLAARRRAWVEARHSVPPVLSFTILTGVATLLHIQKFHFGEAFVWAGAAAWLWLAIYTAVPVVMIALLPGQLRTDGPSPPRRAPLSAAAPVVLAGQGLVLFTVGALLYLDPVRWSSIWPWALTPLTGRATGAWLLGIATGLGAAIAEGDLVRIRPGLVAYAVLGFSELVALARYGSDVDWSAPQAWIYLGIVVSIALIGGLGVLESRKAERADGSGR